MPDETFEEYKIRRKIENKTLENYLINGIQAPSDIKIPMYTCCFTTYGKSDYDVEAASFSIVQIGDKSNKVVYKDWLWREDPITGKVSNMENIDKFLDKNVNFLAKNYKGTTVYCTNGVVPLEKCTSCGCVEYLYRSITYEDYIRGVQAGIFK
jgi:sRNA-binding regulator protein Hfq